MRCTRDGEQRNDLERFDQHRKGLWLERERGNFYKRNSEAGPNLYRAFMSSEHFLITLHSGWPLSPRA